jgi:hypothetical protein
LRTVLVRPVAVFFAGAGSAATVFFAAARFAAGVVVAFFATAIISLLWGLGARRVAAGTRVLPSPLPLVLMTTLCTANLSAATDST